MRAARPSCARLRQTGVDLRQLSPELERPASFTSRTLFGRLENESTPPRYPASDRSLLGIYFPAWMTAPACE